MKKRKIIQDIVYKFFYATKYYVLFILAYSQLTFCFAVFFYKNITKTADVFNFIAKQKPANTDVFMGFLNQYYVQKQTLKSSVFLRSDIPEEL